MQIAFLTAQDVTRYRSLMLHAYEHEADAFTSTVEERAAEPEFYWIHRIGSPQGGRAVFGAREGSELVGAAGLIFSRKPKTRHSVLLIGMYVHPNGRGTGIGRALLEAAQEHALARDGVRTMTLTVTEGNAGAIQLYESFGFKAFGSEPMAILTPSGYKAKVHMWKEIADVPTP